MQEDKKGLYDAETEIRIVANDHLADIGSAMALFDGSILTVAPSVYVLLKDAEGKEEEWKILNNLNIKHMMPSESLGSARGSMLSAVHKEIYFELMKYMNKTLDVSILQEIMDTVTKKLKRFEKFI